MLNNRQQKAFKNYLAKHFEIEDLDLLYGLIGEVIEEQVKSGTQVGLTSPQGITKNTNIKNILKPYSK